MRLIGSFDQENKAFSLYSLLQNHKIETVYEPVKNAMGVVTGYDVWIVSEDDFDAALNLYDQFLKNEPTTEPINSPKNREQLFDQKPEMLSNSSFNKIKIQPISQPLIRIRSLAPLTRILVTLCVFIYLWTSVEQVTMLKKAPSLGQNAFFSKMTASLLFDYPQRFKKLVDFFEQHPNLSLKELAKWNVKERSQYTAIVKLPVWSGYYDLITGLKKDGSNLEAPKFVKISQGEYWRAFTPIFLHGNFLHILFNMLWLFLLGKEIEIKVGKYRFLSMVILLAGLTNTCQYLMSGPLFLGFSGVICGLGGFIFIREKLAPWEGYTVPKGTLGFLVIFVIGMMVLQSIALIFAKMNLGNFSVGNLGNTAHISGLILGCLMAKIPSFYRLRQ